MADGFAAWLDRDIVAARGPEAGAFLQGQLSQDVLALTDGDSAWSWLLSPQGKVDALLRVTRRSGEEWLLDTDGGWGEAMLTRLNRFKLRTKVEFEVLPWRALGRRFADGAPADGTGAAVVTPNKWAGFGGTDMFGPELSVPAGWNLVDADEYEARRILAGFPKMGAELNEKTIPAEVGHIDGTVSFTKGCYTGQELVARVDSRGSNVPRHLRGLAPKGPVVAGSDLVDAAGKAAGSVTSVARWEDGWVALGFVRRAVQPPGPVWAAGVEVDVRELTG